MKSENTKKRVIKISILVSLLFCSVSGVFSQEKRIKVTAEKANIFLQPNISSPVIEKVKRDSVITLRSVNIVRGGWYYVSFISETGITKTGYIQASLVEFTNLPARIIREEKKEPEVPPPPLKPVIPKKEKPRIEKEVIPKPPKKRNNYIKAGVNYFSPPEQRFKDVYGNGMTYTGEIGIGVWKGLKLWIGGGYFTKKGELFFTKEKTKVQIFPIGGGIKYFLTKGRAYLYTGMGLYYYQFKETNPIGDVSKGGLGYVGQIGVFVKFIGRLIIDFNLDYSYCRMRPVERSINIGGFQAGIKLGCEF